MKVTEVRLRSMEEKGKLKAVGSITLDDALVVNGVNVVEGSKGLFISMPSVKGNDGKYYDTAYALSRELRDEIHRMVMDEYQKVCDIDRIIETVELNAISPPGDGPSPEGDGKARTAEKEEKASIRDKLKEAEEKAAEQMLKRNEKVKEASL